MIAVFFAADDPSLTGEELHRRLSALPPTRREAALKQRSDAARRQRVLAWELLCFAFARLKLPMPSSLAVTENGKPYFSDSPLHFSLSHSELGFAVSISDEGEVGVDVERIRSYSRRTARFFCSGQEQALLASLPRKDADSLFTRLWTVKECHVKCTGDGIGRRMKTIPSAAAESRPLPFSEDNVPSSVSSIQSGWLSVAPSGREIRWYNIPTETLRAFAT